MPQEIVSDAQTRLEGLPGLPDIMAEMVVYQDREEAGGGVSSSAMVELSLQVGNGVLSIEIDIEHMETTLEIGARPSVDSDRVAFLERVKVL